MLKIVELWEVTCTSHRSWYFNSIFWSFTQNTALSVLLLVAAYFVGVIWVPVCPLLSLHFSLYLHICHTLLSFIQLNSVCLTDPGCLTQYSSVYFIKTHIQQNVNSAHEHAVKMKGWLLSVAVMEKEFLNAKEKNKSYDFFWVFHELVNKMNLET